MQYFSYDAIARTPLEKEPFEYVIVPNCMSADALSKVGAEFPAVPAPVRILQASSRSKDILRLFCRS